MDEKKVIDDLIERDSKNANQQLKEAKIKDYLAKAGIVIFAIVGIVAVIAVTNQLEKDANNGHFAGQEVPQEVISEKIDPE